MANSHIDVYGPNYHQSQWGSPWSELTSEAMFMSVGMEEPALPLSAGSPGSSMGAGQLVPPHPGHCKAFLSWWMVSGMDISWERLIPFGKLATKNFTIPVNVQSIQNGLVFFEVGRAWWTGSRHGKTGRWAPWRHMMWDSQIINKNVKRRKRRKWEPSETLSQISWQFLPSYQQTL